MSDMWKGWLIPRTKHSYHKAKKWLTFTISEPVFYKLSLLYTFMWYSYCKQQKVTKMVTKMIVINFLNYITDYLTWLESNLCSYMVILTYKGNKQRRWQFERERSKCQHKKPEFSRSVLVHIFLSRTTDPCW